MKAHISIFEEFDDAPVKVTVPRMEEGSQLCGWIDIGNGEAEITLYVDSTDFPSEDHAVRTRLVNLRDSISEAIAEVDAHYDGEA